MKDSLPLSVSFIHRMLALTLAALMLGWLGPAWASGDSHEAKPAQDENPVKGAPKGDIGPVQDVQMPARTFEGQEPLFYLNSQRRPFIEPLQQNETDSYYICRGTVGQWFRELVAQEASMLAQRNGFESVKPDFCALRLIETRTGKKRPIISVELYLDEAQMQTCVLTSSCPNARSVIMYVRDKTLYRSYIIGDRKLNITKEYCLDNQSRILAQQACWTFFANTDKTPPHPPAGHSSPDPHPVKAADPAHGNAQTVPATSDSQSRRAARRAARLLDEAQASEGQDKTKVEPAQHTPPSGSH